MSIIPFAAGQRAPIAYATGPFFRFWQFFRFVSGSAPSARRRRRSGGRRGTSVGLGGGLIVFPSCTKLCLDLVDLETDRIAVEFERESVVPQPGKAVEPHPGHGNVLSPFLALEQQAPVIVQDDRIESLLKAPIPEKEAIQFVSLSAQARRDACRVCCSSETVWPLGHLLVPSFVLCTLRIGTSRALGV